MNRNNEARTLWDEMRAGMHVVTLSFGDAARVCGFSQAYESGLIVNCSQAIAQGLMMTRDDIVPRDGQLQMTPQGRLLGAMLVEKLPPEKQDAWRKQKAAAGYPAL